MKYIKIFLGLFNSAIGYLLGGFDTMLISLLIFMIIDYITGIIKAIIDKKLSSKIGYIGICKKFLILFVIVISTVLDRIVGFNNSIRYLVIGFYLGNEGLSILENTVEIGIPVPEKIKDILNNINEEWYLWKKKK